MNATPTRRLRPILLVLLTFSAIFGTSLTSVAKEIALRPEPGSQESTPTLDDLLTAVAAEVPEFGGMYYSPDGQVLRVFLTSTDRAKLMAVRKSLVALFGDGVIPSGGIKALPGQYGFLQLKKQYDRMGGPILGISGVTLTDIDEARNRIRIGINTSNIEPLVVAQLNQLGIPREAVTIEVTGPIVPSATLDNATSPRQGGYRITRLYCNQTGVGINACTMGFNAKLSSGVAGFVTNSHCTRFSWGLDTLPGCVGFDTSGGGCSGGVSISLFCPSSCPAANFYQAPGYFPAELVGPEFIDPPGFTGGACPAGQTCRWSEAAFVRYNTGVAWQKGIIAKTTGITTSISSPDVTVSTAPPAPGGFGPGKFGIVAPPSMPPVVGLPISKVGRTTGWTQGAIQSTCVNLCFADDNKPNRTLLCQYFVGHPTNDMANGGDSGSAAFRIIDPVLNRVELYGSVWARSANYKSFVFSPIAGVQADLGILDYVVPQPCVLDPGMLAASNTYQRRITLAQTFTPTQSGSLSKITHGLQSNPGVTSYDLLVTTTTSSGLPSWTGGSYNTPNVLYKATGLTIFSTLGIVNGVVPIPSGQEPYLTAGTRYALILIPVGPGQMRWRGNSGAGTYPNGSAYELNGTSWTVPTIGPRDHGFKLDGLCP